jgi:hypothetical protein
MFTDGLFVVMKKGNSETKAQRAERLLLQAQKNVRADGQQNERYSMGDGLTSVQNQAVPATEKVPKPSA